MSAMAYVDGFVTAVPKEKKQEYIESARWFAAYVKELGATRCVDCWGDDVPEGKVTDFRRAVKAEDSEVVCFSWIEYPSKAVRDAVNEKMMSDPRMKDAPMPFDGKRMIYGGFMPVHDGS